MFSPTDASVGVWFTFDKGQNGDVLLVNWINPSGVINGFQPTTTIDYNGSGYYAWFLNIQGYEPATEPGNWQVRVYVNGVVAFTLPFNIGTPFVSSGFSVTSLSTTSPAPLTPLYVQTSGLNVSAPVTVTFSNNAGYSVAQNAVSVKSDGTIAAAVPIYADATGYDCTDGRSWMLTGNGAVVKPPWLTVISHAFLNYKAMGIGRRINELQAFGGLRGNKIDTSQMVSKLQGMLLAVIQARSDADRVSANNSTVIHATRSI